MDIVFAGLDFSHSGFHRPEKLQVALEVRAIRDCDVEFRCRFLQVLCCDLGSALLAQCKFGDGDLRRFA